MKKLNSIIAIGALTMGIICSTTNVKAQDDELKRFELGVRFMPTFTKMDLRTNDNGVIKGQAKFNYGFGGLVGFSFTKHIGVQGEVIYTSITQKFTENNKEGTLDLKYLNIPLLFRLNTNKAKRVNLNLVAGPQIGLSVGSSFSVTAGTDSTGATSESLVKPGDFGFAYGGGLDIALNPSRSLNLGLGYRGVYGLIDVSKNNKSEVTNSSYVLDKKNIVTNAFYVGLSLMF